jgi:dihydrofolate reductase
VASTTRTEREWENSKLIEGEMPEGVRALKKEDGPELQVHGSANLIQTLLEHGLIDEFRLRSTRLCSAKESDCSTAARCPRA